MTTTETPLHIRQAEGLRALADMIEKNPGLAEAFEYLTFGRHMFGEQSEALGVFARIAAGYADGHKVQKRYSEKYAEVEAFFGGVGVRLQAYREEVCEQVGTKTVTKKVKDPEALKAVPEIEVTEELPVWECKPLLAAGTDTEAVTA